MLVLESIEMNNNNGNDGNTYPEILNFIFIHGKCDEVALAEYLKKIFHT